MQRKQLAEPEAGEGGDEKEGRVLLVDSRPLPIGLVGELRMRVAATSPVKARSGGVGHGADLLRLEGLDRAGAFLGSLCGVGHRVVAKAEGLFACGR